VAVADWYIPPDCLTMKIMKARKPAGKKGRTDKLRQTGRPLDRAKVEALSAKISALPVVDARTPEEILGYDAFGIPR
jgi:hypothetical protein